MFMNGMSTSGQFSEGSLAQKKDNGTGKVMATETVFRSKNRQLAEQAIAQLMEERPMTLRQLYYRLISIGMLGNRQSEYKRLGCIMTRLREAEQVPRSWIVDHVRTTLKPSSWTGLSDFGETVRDAYRKDLWDSMPHHVEILVEKHAVAGTVQQVTEEFDIALRVIRGYVSVSFAGEVAELWSKIKKPIYAYYLGDFDPSGFDIERDLKAKLGRYSDKCVGDLEDLDDPGVKWCRQVNWYRLAITDDDFESHDLIRLAVKRSDNRAKSFIQEWGEDCAEIDALPPSELRSRVSEAIMTHVHKDRWETLKLVEHTERESLATIAKAFEKVNLLFFAYQKGLAPPVCFSGQSRRRPPKEHGDYCGRFGEVNLPNPLCAMTQLVGDSFGEAFFPQQPLLFSSCVTPQIHGPESA
jgi:hypothetical protein